jgi:hypothetical protein
MGVVGVEEVILGVVVSRAGLGIICRFHDTKRITDVEHGVHQA